MSPRPAVVAPLLPPSSHLDYRATVINTAASTATFHVTLMERTRRTDGQTDWCKVSRGLVGKGGVINVSLASEKRGVTESNLRVMTRPIGARLNQPRQ